jgi:hypothetical protein
VNLVSPLSRSAAFMAVVERVRRTEPVRAVPEAWVRRVRVGESEAVTIPDVHQALAECIQSSRLLSETSVPWAASAGRKELQG